MYLLECLARLDEDILKARGLEGRFEVGEYYPEFSGIVPQLKDDFSNICGVLDSFSHGYIRLSDENIEELINNVGNFVEMETDWSDQIKIRLVDVKDTEVCFVACTVLYDIYSFNSLMHLVSSPVFSGIPEMTEFSRETAEWLASRLKVYYAIPAVSEGDGYIFDFSHMQNLSAPAYAVSIAHNEVSTAQGWDLAETFDMAYEMFLNGSSDDEMAHEMVLAIDKDFRSKYGRTAFREKTVTLDVLGEKVTYSIRPLKAVELIEQKK